MEETTKAKSQLIMALTEAQKGFKPIVKSATASIKTKAGYTYSYNYATLDALRGACDPELREQGLTVDHIIKLEDGTLWLYTTLKHISGEDSPSSIWPLGSCADDEKEIASRITYGMRYTYSGLLGLAPQEDKDTRPEDAESVSYSQQQSAQNKDKANQPSNAQPDTKTEKGQLHSAYFGAIAGVFDTEEARHDWQDMVTKKESESDWGSAEYDLAKAAVPMAQSGAIKRLLEGTDYTGADDPAFLEMIGRKAILFDREMASKGIEHLSIADRTMVIKLLAPQKAINTLLKSTEYKDIADPKFLESLTKYFEKQVDSIESLNLEERAKVIRSLANKKKNGNGGAK